MKPLGVIHSHDMTKTAVIYKEQNNTFTVCNRLENGREAKFQSCPTVFQAVHEAEDRVKSSESQDQKI